MANFFTDNDDIRFLFDNMDLGRAAEMAEDGFVHSKDFDFAPVDSGDALDNYRRILSTLGSIAANDIAPTADETDRVGNVLADDGTVRLAPGIADALARLAQAELTGFTLPYEYGGLNCPRLVYAMAIDILSRADASLVNFFGLQGVAEVLSAFGSDELKNGYLPELAAGRKTGAMALTEPDAGSDLQAVKTVAHQDGRGGWRVNGVKRFITNGGGDVLLVLARSEPDTADGRGLSLFLVERGSKVKVRRLEEKLGIHGSPTCELFFDDAPALLIGQRGRGLSTYVASLMDGARMGIAAQSLGISEAAYRIAREFARRRSQFGTRIDAIPAVRELLADMSVEIQAARALTYFTSYCVDIENGASRRLQRPDVDVEESNRLKEEGRKYKRYSAMLIPVCKYHASEMSVRVTNSAIAVLGGSGYMRDYAAERHFRDSRITTIYEGTTQIQIASAIRPVLGGTAKGLVEELSNRGWTRDAAELAAAVREGLALFDEAVKYTADRADADYADLHGRRLVDMASALVIGSLLCAQSSASDSRRAVCRRWIESKRHELRHHHDVVCSGDRTAIDDFDALRGRALAGE
jgi:alkylation response protein AidB-like acyl-CoA dehydrogenase